MALIRDMLLLLPSKFSETYDTGSALGAALQAAFKLMVWTDSHMCSTLSRVYSLSFVKCLISFSESNWRKSHCIPVLFTQ